MNELTDLSPCNFTSVNAISVKWRCYDFLFHMIVRNKSSNIYKNVAQCLTNTETEKTVKY